MVTLVNYVTRYCAGATMWYDLSVIFKLPDNHVVHHPQLRSADIVNAGVYEREIRPNPREGLNAKP